MMKRNPFEQFEQLANQFESMMDTDVPSKLFRKRFPRIDVAETENEIVITVDAPGYNSEDLNITVENSGRVLAISGERNLQTDESDEEYVWKERHTHTIERKIPLPTKVQDGDATAECSNGVVTITLPKSETTQESIQIEVTEE